MKVGTLGQTEIRELQDLVQARTGLTFPESRLADLRSGLERAMETVGATELEEFAELLDTDRQTFDTLIANITVAETYFFREPAQFDVLRKLVLPDLRRTLPFRARLRLWSAGCASGEEPYSLAILLEREGLAEVATILATDISRTALARARDASYGIWSLRGNEGDTASRCFERRGDRFQLHERFRRRVDFRYLNLASNAYPAMETSTADIDLILCRNVLIYFDQETVRHVARQFFNALRDGGWLITGPSDPPLWDWAPYRTVVTSAGVFYQRGGESPARTLAPAVAENSMPPPSFAADLPRLEPVPTVDVAAPPPPAIWADGPADCEAWISRVRQLADHGASRAAEVEVGTALLAFPLDPRLHYLKAVALAELNRLDDAAAALRVVVYLDPTLPLPHFMLGSILLRTGATAEARRFYRNTLELCHGLPQHDIVALSDAEPVHRLLHAARDQIARIDAARK